MIEAHPGGRHRVGVDVVEEILDFQVLHQKVELTAELLADELGLFGEEEDAFAGSEVDDGGRFHRLEPDDDPARGFGRIEGFWGYLQRQLRAKGGVRRERLPLYIAEYVWRYNRRDTGRSMFHDLLAQAVIRAG